MRTGQVIFGKGINRSQDPRYIGDDEQYLASNLEVIRQGTLSKRKGFGRYTTELNSLGSPTLPICGVHLMYDSDGIRYLFVFVDASPGVDLYVEKNGSFIGSPTAIADFFPSKGTRIRSAVFGDKIYFVNGQDRPRWYKEYDGAAHIWGIGGVPSPARRPADESSYNYFVSRAEYRECIVSNENLGIELPGIWRYRQSVGYFGKESTEQIEESNAGPASKMFHCQFNIAEALGTTLSGYVKKGIDLGIANYNDLILDAGETGGQDYEDFIRWMRLSRQWKMFSDELYSPFEFLVEMKKGWSTSIKDVYSRDSALVAPTTRVSLPVAHHIEKANNRLFLGRVEKELFSQPGLPKDFRTLSTYKPNFSYRWPITIHNTGSKTLTSAVIPLRFQKSDDTDTTATLPAGGGTWTGGYINWNVNFNTYHDEMMFVDEDGVTPLGYVRISSNVDDITFLVEIPEIVAGGSRTIYLYAEDSVLDGETPQSGEPGHFLSIAHYPLCASDHWMLADFENWDSGIAVTDVTQKRSLGKIEQQVWTAANGGSRDTITDMFFNKGTFTIADTPVFKVHAPGATETDAAVKFYPPANSSTFFSVAFLAAVSVSSTAGHAYIDITKADGTICIRFAFTKDATHATLVVTAYDTDGTSKTITMTEFLSANKLGCDGDWIYYILTVDGDEWKMSWVYADGNGHPAEGASWSTTNYNNGGTTQYDLAKAIRLDSTGMYFGARVKGAIENATYVKFKEMQILDRKLDTASPHNGLVSHINRDSYFPSHGLAVVGDRESASGADKFPDRFYFSDLNAPNSFDAVNFRDLGNKGHPIQGIKGLQNRVFIFTPSEVRALFSAGSEHALALGSGDTTMWNLSQDLTGELGSLGVLAPDTLINMEFAGKNGIGFLSARGYHFFDGERFAHLSQKVDTILKSEGEYGRLEYASAHYLAKRRQLIISTLNYAHTASSSNIVANLMYAGSVDEVVWTRWGTRIALGVELDDYLDNGAFVYGCVHQQTTPIFLQQLLKLEGDGTYIDKKYGSPVNTDVYAEAWSKHYEVFDSELLKIDFVIDKASASEEHYFLRIREANVAGTQQGTIIATITNPQNAMIFLPIGTHAKKLMFELYEQSDEAVTFHGFTFFYNQHGHRRLAGG